jgi:hypothetical protein
MRRFLGLALAAGSLVLLAPHAQASVECHRVAVDDQWVEECSGSWCPDVCFIVAYVDCDLHVKVDCPIGFTR